MISKPKIILLKKEVNLVFVKTIDCLETRTVLLIVT